MKKITQKKSNLKLLVESIAEGMKNGRADNTGGKVAYPNTGDWMKILDICRSATSKKDAIDEISDLLGYEITVDTLCDHRGPGNKYGPDGTFGDLYDRVVQTKELSKKWAEMDAGKPWWSGDSRHETRTITLSYHDINELATICHTAVVHTRDERMKKFLNMFNNLLDSYKK